MKIGGLEKILRKSAMFLVSGYLAFNLINCGGKDESPTAPSNNPPEVYITNGPSNGEEINDDSVEFGWFGVDLDVGGSISMYKYMLSPKMDNYQETDSTSCIFTNLGSGPYLFSVFARDNVGEWSLEAAERNFSVYKEYTLTLQHGPEGIDAEVGGVWENGEPTGECDKNYGDENSLQVRYWNVAPFVDIWRSYLKFDLSSISSNVDIINATFSLFSYITSGSIDVQLCKVISDWSEDEITWNNQPPYDPYVYDTQTISEVERFYDFDVTDLGNEWLNDYNNGLVLKLSYEFGETNFCGFYSSDYEDSSKRPKLKVDYVINQ